MVACQVVLRSLPDGTDHDARPDFCLENGRFRDAIDRCLTRRGCLALQEPDDQGPEHEGPERRPQPTER